MTIAEVITPEIIGQGQLLPSGTIVPPATPEAAVESLRHLADGINAGEWATAAVIYAITERGTPGPRSVDKSTDLLTITELADKKIRGLKSRDAIIRYRGIWQLAIDTGLAAESQMGVPCVLPTKDSWSEAADAYKAASKAVRTDELRAIEAAAMTGAKTKPHIDLSDAVTWLRGIEAGTVDLLITDPPYVTDVVDLPAFVNEWVPAALATLKSSGRAFIFTGAYPIEIHTYLTALLAVEDVTVANLMAWHYPDTLGPDPAYDYKTTWQAIHHIRGIDATPLRSDVLTEKTTIQKFNMNSKILGGRRHEWQKPDALAERLIVHATQPGDLVIDPFNGTGTFALAANRLGRVARGCEMSEEMLAISAERGCDVHTD